MQEKLVGKNIRKTNSSEKNIAKNTEPIYLKMGNSLE